MKKCVFPRFKSGLAFILSLFIGLNPVLAMMPHADILSSVSIPAIDPAIGSVSLIHEGKSEHPIIYMIQDAHTNESAQINISNLLGVILQKTAARYVFMEAGYGDESIRFIRNEHNLNQLKKTGYEFLRKGILQGAEYQNLISEQPFVIWGVEDNRLYDEALEMYKTVAGGRLKALEGIARMKNALSALENRLFSQTVRELHHSIESFDSGDIGFDEHFDFILKLMTRLELNSADYPHFKEIIELKQTEGNLNFEDVNQEFVEFMSTLNQARKEQKSEEIKSKFKDSDVDYWIKLMQSNRLEKRYPELNRYFNYIQHIQSIRMKGALEELITVNQHLIQTLASERESEIISLQNQVSKIEKLVKLQADAECFREVSESFGQFQPEYLSASINRVLTEQNLFPEKLIYEEPSLSRSLQSAMNFYRLTLRRDSRMLENAVRKIQTEHLKEAVMIAGGFHTENLVEQLKRSGYSIVLINPVVTHETDLNRYERLLLDTQDHESSLTALFSDNLKTSELMRRRLLNQPEDLEQFIGIVRPDLLDRIGEIVARPTDAPLAPAPVYIQELTAAARLSSQADVHRVAEIELLLKEWDLNRVSEDEQAETLLALLYGGSTVFPFPEDDPRQENPYYSGRAGYSEGLIQILSRAEFNNKKQLQSDARRLIQEIETSLNKLGIPKVLDQSDGSVFNLHEALAIDRYYFNPFLISFTGLPDYAQGEDEGRFQKALQLLNLKKSKKKKAEQLFLTYLDVYQPQVEIDGKEIYSLRVKHNDSLGTPKGGVRYVTASALLNDDVFRERFERLIALGAPREVIRYFVRRWVKQETLPLAVGMTIKTSAVNAAEKEGWWAEVFRSIFGSQAAHTMLGGAKGSILLADVVETDEGLVLKDIFERSPEGLLRWHEVTRAYAADLYLNGKIGPDIDVPAPDVGVPPGAMDVATDEVLKIELTRLKSSGILDGWPASLDEIRNRFIELLAESESSAPNETNILKYLSEIAVDLEEGELSLDEAGRNALQPLLELRSVFTAKSIDPEYLSGSTYRIEATGYGVVHVLDQVVRMSLDELKEKFKKLYPAEKNLLSVERQPLQYMTAKVMGFGNVGFEAVSQLIERGVRVQMISEGPNGIIRKESGFTKKDLERLLELKKRHPNEPYFKLINNEQDTDIKIQDAHIVNGGDPELSFYNTHANIFVLAAKENTITTRNVAKMKADIYIEGANGAISYAAYDVLEKRGSIVIPDSLANAGGVVVSYFEMLQNRLNKRWPSRKVISRLEGYLNKAISEINEYRIKYKTDWRTATDVRTIETLLKADAGARLADSTGSVQNLNQNIQILRDQIENYLERASPSESMLAERALGRLNQINLDPESPFSSIPEALPEAQRVLNQAYAEFEVYHASEITAAIRNFNRLINDLVNYAQSVETGSAIRTLLNELQLNTDAIVLSEENKQLQDQIRKLNFVVEQFEIFLSHVRPDNEGLLWSPSVQRVALGFALRIRRLSHELYLSIDESELLWSDEQTLLTHLSEKLNQFQTAAPFESVVSKEYLDDLNRILESNPFTGLYPNFSIRQILSFRFETLQDNDSQITEFGYFFSEDETPNSTFVISPQQPINLLGFSRDVTRYLVEQDMAFILGLSEESGIVGEDLARQWNVSYERWLIKSSADGARLSDLQEAQNDAVEIHRYLSEVIDRAQDAYRSRDFISAMSYLRDAVIRLNTDNYSTILRNTITTGGGLMSIYDFNNMANALHAYLESDSGNEQFEYTQEIERNFRRIELFLDVLERFSRDENQPYEIVIKGNIDLEPYAPKDTFVYLPVESAEQLLEMLELYAGSPERNIYRLLVELWATIDEFQLDGQIFEGVDVQFLLPAVIREDYGLSGSSTSSASALLEQAEETGYDYLQEESASFSLTAQEWGKKFTDFEVDRENIFTPLLNQEVLAAESEQIGAVISIAGKEVYVYDAESHQSFILSLASENPVAAIRVLQSTVLIQHTDGTMTLFKKSGDQFLRKQAIPETDTPDPLRPIEIRGSDFYVPIVDSPISFIQINPSGQISYHDDDGARLADASIYSEMTENLFSEKTKAALALFIKNLQSQSLRLADRIFDFRADNGQVVQLQVRAENDRAETLRYALWVLDLDGFDRLLISSEQIQSVDPDRSGEGYRDDLRLFQQIQTDVQSELNTAPNRNLNLNQKKVVGFDLSVLEGKGLSDQAVYEAVLPLLAAEFHMRHMRSSRQTVFYLSGPGRWISQLYDLSVEPGAYLFYDGHALPQEFETDRVQRSDLIRPDAPTEQYRGITIPIIAPEQLGDQVSLFPVTAILDFAEAASELLNSKGEIDPQNFIPLKNAYEVFIGQSIEDNIFRDILTGKADVLTMSLYGIPSLKYISINRFIKVFTMTARMSAQSA